jgi:hypothetical protein
LAASEAARAKIEGPAATHRSLGSMITVKRTPTKAGEIHLNPPIGNAINGEVSSRRVKCERLPQRKEKVSVLARVISVIPIYTPFHLWEYVKLRKTHLGKWSSWRFRFARPKRRILDTIVFVLIFFTLLAMRAQKRWLVLTLYFVSLAATMLLFNHHVTSELNLNF